ncbi:MAG: acetylglutamate kinase [Fibrobacter sp.]|jgi:acetylglutamate kinase|nr:acetylglutamate kinase [Fibrobacter sp.]
MKKVVVKIGGSLAIDEDKLFEFVSALSRLPGGDFRIALVHGGGKDINENLALLSEKPQFIDGLRVTTASIMNMVEMTLSGHVNKKLVRMLMQKKCPAIGISGVDGGLFHAKKHEGAVDLGFVGDIDAVNPKIVEDLWNADWTPVVSPISLGDSFSWNVNADVAASELAVALKADQFVLVSDVPGVMDREKQVIPELSEAKTEELIQAGVITGGMIPKVRSSLNSIKRGLKAIHIVGWKDEEHFYKQILGEVNYGTILN